MKFLISYIQRFVSQDTSAHKLALTFCVAIYIAFSPFIGLHTIMAFGASWLFNFNLPMLVAVSYGINNPWTAIPIYMLDYMVGYWLLHTCFHLGTYIYNPAMFMSIAQFFQQKLGFAIPCLWSFLIGGNLLAIMVSICLYPWMFKLFNQLLQRSKLMNA